MGVVCPLAPNKVMPAESWHLPKGTKCVAVLFLPYHYRLENTAHIRREIMTI